MKCLLFAFAGGLMMLAAEAQTKVDGRVIDASTSEPLVGATVQELNTNNGTITNEEGKFSLTIDNPNSRIKIDYLGYETEILEVKQTFMTIQLQSDYNLEEVIIETVRADDEPVAYSTVQRKQIEKVYNGQQPIYFLEELTPSIFTYSESGTRLANYGNLRLRGVSQERINMTLNGIPLNDMIDHGVFFSNFTDIGNSIASVQVQRGVGTSSNGVASYAGSINFESINLRKNEAGGALEVGVGSFDTRRFNASASTGMINDKWSAYSSFSRLYSDGYRRNTFTDAYSFFLSVGYFGEKDFFKINAFDANSKNGLGYAAVLKSDLDNDPRTNYLNENDQDDFGQQLVQFQHTHKFSGYTSLTSSLYYGAAGGDFLFTDLISTPSYQINYPLYNKHYGLMSNMLWAPTDKFELNAGAHGYIFNRENEEAFAPDFANPYYEDHTHKKELSAFAKADYTINRLTLYADLQVRTQKLTIEPDYDFTGTSDQGKIEKNWTFFNPKIGVQYMASRNLNAYASFGRTGREPTRVDLLGGFQLNASNIDYVRSDTFKPEFVNDLEAGVRFGNQNLKFNANYFYMDFENEISPLGEVVAFGVQLRKNIEDSYRTGIELEGEYTPFSLLTFSGNITYMQSEIRQVTDETSEQTYSNVTPILSPEWIYGVSASLLPVSHLSIAISGRGIGESYLDISNDENLMLPAYWVADFRINYSIAFLELAFEINNLLDKTYYGSGAPVDVDYDGVIDGPGYLINADRNYFLTTRINF